MFILPAFYYVPGMCQRQSWNKWQSRMCDLYIRFSYGRGEKLILSLSCFCLLFHPHLCSMNMIFQKGIDKLD